MITAKFRFENNEEVTKHIQEDFDERVTFIAFNRACKEAWRDYLSAKFGSEWHKHDHSKDQPNDIVKRLRLWQHGKYTIDPPNMDKAIFYEGDCGEAADEIEELRFLVKR